MTHCQKGPPDPQFQHTKIPQHSKIIKPKHSKLSSDTTVLSSEFSKIEKNAHHHECEKSNNRNDLDSSKLLDFENNQNITIKTLSGKSSLNFLTKPNHMAPQIFTAQPFHTDIGADSLSSPQKMSTDGTSTSNYLPSVNTQLTQFWPRDIITILHSTMNELYEAPSASKFEFELNDTAAAKNWINISSHGNLGNALESDKSSFTRYGSEFRPVTTLTRIFKFHPLWDRLKSILGNGIQFPLSPLDDTSLKLDLDFSLAFGNHKGVRRNPKFFDELNQNDVQFGYAIPIPIEKIYHMKGAAICPMNVIEQNTISMSGEIIDKRRACHDLSFKSGHSDTSVNSRVIEEELQDCKFGYCLLRIVHFIVALRTSHPNTPILIQKIDWKSAYPRAHNNWKTAIQCCSVYKRWVLIPLRAVFGGSPCPSEWGIISESTTDLANLLLNHNEWDPDTLYSPDQQHIPPPRFLPDDIGFEKGLPLMVSVPTEQGSKSDVYIDDMITVSLANEDNIKRAEAAVPLAIYSIGRPIHAQEPITRKNLMCFRKLLAEGRLEETKTILGWKIDTRRLLIQLPQHKYIAWKDSILIIISSRQTNFKDLETLLGRLTHMSTILPNILHFLGNIRRLCMSASKRRKVKVNQIHVDDLDLMLQFLDKARSGINLNTITFRQPSHIYFADACPEGMGGYSHLGKAWRWKVPDRFKNRATVNMLEHVASTIGPWIDMINGDLPKLSCVLSMTDSTTSAGWLRKSNFADDGDSKSHMRAKLHAARAHAARLLEFDIREYSQWFPGELNLIADSLSRDFHLSDSQLVNLFTSRFSSQIHHNFKIVPIPEEINCWLCAWLQLMPEHRLQPEAHRPSNLEHGSAGRSSFDPLICPKIYSSTGLQMDNESSSFRHLHNQFDRPSTQNREFINWVAQQSEIPSIMWLRPSGATCDTTPDSTQMAKLQRFYSHNSRRSKTKTHHQSNRKPYPVVC